MRWRLLGIAHRLFDDHLNDRYLHIIGCYVSKINVDKALHNDDNN